MIAKYEDPGPNSGGLLPWSCGSPTVTNLVSNWQTGWKEPAVTPVMAEFIRADIAYWRAVYGYSPAGDSAEQIAELKEKRDLLLDGHVKRWREPLYKVVRWNRNISFCTRRGSIGNVEHGRRRGRPACHSASRRLAGIGTDRIVVPWG